MNKNNPFTVVKKDQLRSLGERKLIDTIKVWLGKTNPNTPYGIGDDCAVIPNTNSQLITVDPLIYGRHFDDTVSAYHAGEKLIKRNISDIAAMGGKPTCCVISLTLDPTVKITWLKKFYLGLKDTAQSYAIKIVGGDIAELKGSLAATLTLLGEKTTNRFLTRHTAKSNDLIFVTGKLGLSLPSKHHYTFTPRIKEAQWLVKKLYVTSLMDISDGLAKDIHSLIPKKAAACIYADKIPLKRGATVKNGLCDGEDYELLFTVKPTANLKLFEAQWKKRFPDTPLTLIGHMSPASKKNKTAINLSTFQGFEHLA